MNYEIETMRSVERSLRKHDPPVRRKLQEAIDRLAETPRPAHEIPLTGLTEFWRVRVGGYRIVTSIVDGILWVLVVTVGHRSIDYRQL